MALSTFLSRGSTKPIFRRGLAILVQFHAHNSAHIRTNSTHNSAKLMKHIPILLQCKEISSKRSEIIVQLSISFALPGNFCHIYQIVPIIRHASSKVPIVPHIFDTDNSALFKKKAPLNTGPSPYPHIYKGTPLSKTFLYRIFIVIQLNEKLYRCFMI